MWVCMGDKIRSPYQKFGSEYPNERIQDGLGRGLSVFWSSGYTHSTQQSQSQV
uniref:Uncharacterized protein n=1 Tax=Rhizophora mucronata TaxID=61149 RepID=A0A2P2KIW0_RHIMU